MREYCSTFCLGRAKAPKSYIPLTACTSDTGAASEMMACIDLIKKGFTVFRAVSPSASCDLIAIAADGSIVRIEVKTGYYAKSGAVTFRHPKRPELYDVLVIVIHKENEVIYRPEISGQPRVPQAT